MTNPMSLRSHIKSLEEQLRVLYALVQPSTTSATKDVYALADLEGVSAGQTTRQKRILMPFFTKCPLTGMRTYDVRATHASCRLVSGKLASAQCASGHRARIRATPLFCPRLSWSK